MLFEGKVTAMADSRLGELERTCFVIMPFGVKDAMGEQVDFDQIYRDVFDPAIKEVMTPENVPLETRRTDQDFFSGSINQEMFEYIVYSRLAFADISGLNPNVLYEIGVRHGVQAAGTVLFRQTGHPIPFDITTIKVFEYDREQPDDARALIARVVSETMAHNRLDSPVRLALRAQWGLGPENTDESDRGPAPHSAPEPGPGNPGRAGGATSTEIVGKQGSRVVVTVKVE